MADQQTPDQQPPEYPYFPMTTDGLGRLYQEYGRLMHLSIERGIQVERQQQLRAATRAFAARHTGDGCRPIPQAEPATDDANGHADIPTVAEVIGASADAAAGVPEPIRMQRASRRKGG